jgi:hypothetical protein
MEDWNVYGTSERSFNFTEAPNLCAHKLKFNKQTHGEFTRILIQNNLHIFLTYIYIYICFIAKRGDGELTPYLLTPWSRVLLKRLTSFQLVKKFPAFHRTRKFITAFTSARHLSLY